MKCSGIQKVRPLAKLFLEDLNKAENIAIRKIWEERLGIPSISSNSRYVRCNRRFTLRSKRNSLSVLKRSKQHLANHILTMFSCKIRMRASQSLYYFLIMECLQIKGEGKKVTSKINLALYMII